ncbi:MAG: hypothetical protein HYZ14_07870 [Bacteroidetes bacterium]|nr:hypothetical protein [Bacteroidota bacterium]
MNTNDWAYYAHCSRLKTKRTKKRLQKKDQEKQLISMAKELFALYEKQRNREYEKLENPYQKGWLRTFVLRDETTLLPTATVFEKILNVINTIQYSERRDFKIKRRRFRKRVYVKKPQELTVLNELQLNRLFNEKERNYFERVEHFDQKRRTTVVRYHFMQPWRFRLKVSPYMITHVRIVDAESTQKISEIRSRLLGQNLEARMWKMLYGYAANKRWRCEPPPRYKHFIKSEPVHKLKRDYETEKLYGNKN